MSDYGAWLYPNVLVTRAALITEQPTLVEGVVRATLRGYRYAFEHPEEAVRLTLQQDATLDATFQQESWAATIPFIDVGDIFARHDGGQRVAEHPGGFAVTGSADGPGAVGVAVYESFYLPAMTRRI
jgi:hypothetical protein